MIAKGPLTMQNTPAMKGSVFFMAFRSEQSIGHIHIP
jgi:hypothetical protein